MAFCARHLYALYCLLRHEVETSSDTDVNSSDAMALPEIFRDSGWSTLGTSILSHQTVATLRCACSALVPLPQMGTDSGISSRMTDCPCVRPRSTCRRPASSTHSKD